jgi:hypothetical protein
MSKDKKTPMTPADAARIQGHADRTDTNPDFKGRAQRGAANNPSPDPKPPERKK